MTTRSIHQVLVGAARGDAVTSMALTLRSALRRLGPSEIYSHHLASDVVGDVSPLTHLRRSGPNDVIVYHSSIGEPSVTRWLLGRSEQMVLVFHNITPSRYFLDHEPHFAANLEWGRHELGLLRDKIGLAIAVSDFNAAELAALGYCDVHVVPAGLVPSRLSGAGYDGHLARRIREQFPHGYVLSVSQALPHKRFESLIEAMHLAQWVHERQLGLVIVGTHRMRNYQRALEVHARSLRVRQMLFHGAATNPELATFYRMASMYVTTSAHEGLALPPLEAMSFGVPVIARAAGAVADTIGGAGLVLPADAGPMLISEAIAEVDTNYVLQSELRRRGAARVAAIESEDPATRFVELLQGVC